MTYCDRHLFLVLVLIICLGGGNVEEHLLGLSGKCLQGGERRQSQGENSNDITARGRQNHLRGSRTTALPTVKGRLLEKEIRA